MIKITPHILSDEADKRETTICIVYASVVVFGMMTLLLHGLAFFQWTTETNEEIYQRKYMANQIEDLYQWRTGMAVEYENHKHQFWTGKIKQEKEE